MPEVHPGIFQSSPAFPMIARRAGGDNILPAMRSSQMAWNDVVNGQIDRVFATILAGVVIPPQDLPPRK